MDSKFLEQTKQINEIFSLLDKRHADNKLDEVNKGILYITLISNIIKHNIYLVCCSSLVTSMTPSPTLTTSTSSVSVSTLETTTATSG